MGNFTVFATAITALRSNTTALSVVSNNIANINTPGYSRQTVSLTANQTQTFGGEQIGRGVNVTDIARSYSNFADLRVRSAVQSQGFQNAVFRNVRQIESVFNELDSGGLAEAMTHFFDGFDEIANDPQSINARQNVLNQARTMVNSFHSLSQHLVDDRELIDGDVQDIVTKINTLSSEIHDLTIRINAALGEPNSLKDQRIQKVKELAQYIDVNCVETSDNDFQVYVAQGILLVSGIQQSTLSTQVDDTNSGLRNVLLSVGAGTGTDITSRINGGELQGLINVRDDIIPEYQERLDHLAYKLATEVNKLHAVGYDLDGDTSNDFFTDLSVSATGTDLATELRRTDGTTLGIEAGDTISIGGNVGATALAATISVTSSTTLADIASSLQVALRAAGNNTETVTVLSDGSLRVTSGAAAITSLALSISGNTTFNTAYTFSTPIAGGGGTGDSADVSVEGDESAASIALSSDVDGSPRNIAAASTSGTVPGGNANALLLAALKAGNVTFRTGSDTLQKYYGNLLAQIGADSAGYQSQSDFADSVVRQAEVERERISGVAIEEEQLDLVKYQAAFQAASRLVGVAADLLQSLIQIF